MPHVYMLYGQSGLIGDALHKRLLESNAPYRVFAFDRPRADVSNKTHIAPIFKYVRPTVVFNCAGVNDPEMCQDAPSGAFAVNTVGAEILAAECARHGAKLVHVSSCNVFDGKRLAPYSEKCVPNPISVLGQSKWAGEQSISGACKDHLIIRPGWAFHYEGENPLTEWVSNADRGLNIPVLGGLQGSPAYVPDVVDAMLALVAADARGTFHVANKDAATWQTFAEAVVELTKARARVIPTPEIAGTRAPSPKYAVLSTKKFSTATGKAPRPWLDALKECLFEMHRYKP